ncbi:hypothetical protein FRC0485_01597 [Corynebacterium diphtheriae]|nr:hypothetical protein FRC0485_01597 [Corynebacterium diphtheriae]
MTLVRLQKRSISRNRHHTRIGICCITVATLSLSACSSENSSSKETRPKIEQAIGAQVDTPRVTLIDHGNSPQQLVTYRDDGAQTTRRIKISDGLTHHTESAAQLDTTAPHGGDVTSLTTDATVSTTRSDSQRSVTAIIDHPTIDDLERSRDIDSTHGFQLGWFGANNGRISSVNLAAPVDASDDGRALMERFLMKMVNIPIIFPEEPIGPSARWTVDSRVTGEATMLQTTTFTLTSIKGNNVELDVSITQRPALGAIEAQGTTLHVLNANTTSNGNLRVDLSQPLPTEGTLRYTTRVIYGEREKDVRVVQDSTTSIEFSTP